MMKLYPKLYQKYILTENRKPLMYTKFNIALNGTLQAELLFWRNLQVSLKEWVFNTNTNDSFVSNYGKWITVLSDMTSGKNKGVLFQNKSC